MSTGLNSRQHQVLLNIFSGIPQRKAYQAVYPVSDSVADTNCSSLLALPKFSKELNRLRHQKELVAVANSVQDSIATPTERKQILTELLRAQLVDFQDEKGEPKLSKDTPHARAAKEYYHRQRFDKGGNPIVTKSIKLADQIAAIQELNKMEGSYAPTKHLVGQVRFNVNLVDKGKRGEETPQ